MTRYLPAAASLLLLVAAAAPPLPAGLQMPTDITIRSAVGEVYFRHEAHVKERSIACVDCHHQINAKKLATPHPDYLKSSWINCTVCHDGAGRAKQKPFACSGCHRPNPKNIADETLSAKVVIHQQCWKCHPVNTGKQASASCQLCHSGEKNR